VLDTAKRYIDRLLPSKIAWVKLFKPLASMVSAIVALQRVANEEGIAKEVACATSPHNIEGIENMMRGQPRAWDSAID